jgi:hypothetical protein
MAQVPGSARAVRATVRDRLREITDTALAGYIAKAARAQHEQDLFQRGSIVDPWSRPPGPRGRGRAGSSG